MARKPEEFTILVDTREQRPYFFQGYPCVVKKKALKTGDYSIEGHEKEITIERKSKRDLFLSVSKERDRFEREYQRLSEFPYPFLVIESSFSGLFTPPVGSQMNPKSVIQTVISWGIRYDIPVYFVDTREMAQYTIYSIFEKYLYNMRKVNQKGGEALGSFGG